MNNRELAKEIRHVAWCLELWAEADRAIEAVLDKHRPEGRAPEPAPTSEYGKLSKELGTGYVRADTPAK